MHLLFSLASLIVFYKGDRNGTPISLKDNQNVLDFFRISWREPYNTPEVVEVTLSNIDFWGTDLTLIDGLEERVHTYLVSILNKGMKNALKTFIK